MRELQLDRGQRLAGGLLLRDGAEDVPQLSLEGSLMSSGTALEGIQDLFGNISDVDGRHDGGMIPQANWYHNPPGEPHSASR